jgi:hypothetical protein
VTVPRGTVHPKGWEPRLSVRVSPAQKAAVRYAVAALQRRGLRTSESELVELLVYEGVSGDVDVLEHRLRRWRAEKELT